MELVEVSNEWTTGVDHVVMYDTWEQFVICNDNLNRMWRDMILLSWACRPELSGFVLQLVYISKEPFLSTIINGNTRRYEQRCVEIKFKSNQASTIAKWLVYRNPDLWKMNDLIRISPPNLKEAT
jgi:hypothetical protein